MLDASPTKERGRSRHDESGGFEERRSDGSTRAAHKSSDTEQRQRSRDLRQVARSAPTDSLARRRQDQRTSASKSWEVPVGAPSAPGPRCSGDQNEELAVAAPRSRCALHATQGVRSTSSMSAEDSARSRRLGRLSVNPRSTEGRMKYSKRASWVRRNGARSRRSGVLHAGLPIGREPRLA